MSSIVCVIDACSFINLLAIDDNDILYKSVLKNVRIQVCETVLKEINANFKHKNKLNRDPSSVGIKLGKLRGSCCVYDHEIVATCGDNFFENVRANTNYQKQNGEFHSNALSLYLSQKGNILLTFLTDDSPAKEEFTPFFARHQIGNIVSTADFLLLLFRLDKTLTKIQMRQFLDALYKEYAREVALLLEALRSTKSDINSDKKYRKKIPLKKNLNNLISKLDQHDFENIEELKNKLIGESRLKDILKNYDQVFHLYRKTEDSYLKQIKQIQGLIEKNRVMRITFE